MCKSTKQPKHTSNNSTMQMLKQLSLSILRFIIIRIHGLFDAFLDFCFEMYYRNKVNKVPPISNPLLFESATDLAKKIREKQVSCEEVVRAFVERCKEVNLIINAIVEERYDEAIKEAQEVDNLLKTNKDESFFKAKPFLGIPFVTKESNEAKGLLHSMGLYHRQNHRSDEDSTVVARLKNAGGIILGKTNIPELNMWTESRNLLYGQTNNPYNTTRTVGGSSGGDGATVAACGVPVTISSDIGGSIRMPAAFNGVFGHKPSEGLTPMKGVGLRNKDYSNSMAEAGPICKRAVDLEPMLRILIGDKVSRLKLDKPVDLRKLAIFYQEESGDIRTSTVNVETIAAMRKVVRHFQGITGTATKVKLPGSEYSYRLWRYWMTKEEDDFKLNLTNRKYRTDAKTEIKNLFTFTSRFTLAPIFKLIDEDFFPKENAKWAEELTETLKNDLLNKLGDNGVLFYTSMPFPASYHYSAFFRPFNFGYWCLFNVLRFPTCQVPLGLDKDGLPLGIQVVAAPDQDHLCLAVAKELENAFGGWVAPS